MRSGFARLHPLVDLTFFVLVLAFAMFLSHPAVQLAGLVCAALFALRCTGRGFGRRMAILLPLMLLAAVVNPLVSHQGVTVLFRFPSGNACTLESVLYGISAAVRLGTAVLWFMGWNAVMTSDKFVYLFGRILPSLSLTLSMGLRFVPRLLRRTREVAQAQKLARPAERGWLAGIRRAGRVVSIVVTWALENALDTADSMKSRGYGLPKRTAFSLFRFTLRDGICLGVLAALGGIVLAGSLTGGLKWWYYPAPGGAAGVQAALWIPASYLPSFKTTPVVLSASFAVLPSGIPGTSIISSSSSPGTSSSSFPLKYHPLTYTLLERSYKFAVPGNKLTL